MRNCSKNTRFIFGLALTAVAFLAALAGCQDKAKPDAGQSVTPTAVVQSPEAPVFSPAPTQPKSPQPGQGNTVGVQPTGTPEPVVLPVETTRTPVEPRATSTAQASQTPTVAPVAKEPSAAPFKHKDFGILLTHASVSSPNSGCGMCHTQPLKQSCVSCHQSPPIHLVDKQSNVSVQFPHHSTSAGGSAPNICQLCHTGSANDVRVVTVPQMAHNFCRTCHPLQHT